jgi:hypothetical protein
MTSDELLEGDNITRQFDGLRILLEAIRKTADENQKEQIRSLIAADRLHIVWTPGDVVALQIGVSTDLVFAVGAYDLWHKGQLIESGLNRQQAEIALLKCCELATAPVTARSSLN